VRQWPVDVADVPVVLCPVAERPGDILEDALVAAEGLKGHAASRFKDPREWGQRGDEREHERTNDTPAHRGPSLSHSAVGVT
jgi:hypothetical protein